VQGVGQRRAEQRLGLFLQLFEIGTLTVCRNDAVTPSGPVGIDVSHHTSKDVSVYANESFDSVITVCDRAKQQCPVFPGAEPIHWGFDDPAEAPPNRQVEIFRRVRNEIRQRLNLFVLANQK